MSDGTKANSLPQNSKIWTIELKTFLTKIVLGNTLENLFYQSKTSFEKPKKTKIFGTENFLLNLKNYKL